MKDLLHNLKITFLLLFTLHVSNSDAQAIKNEIIVTLAENQVDRFAAVLENDLRSIDYQYKLLSRDLGIVLISTTEEQSESLVEKLKENKMVASWSYNHKAQKREMPDDEYFDMQWALEMIEATRAWDVSTGGSDLYDREIVVAVLDDGFYFDHPELEGVFLVNDGEIEDDGVDNDNNGYIDDYNGWNSATETDEHPQTDNHGIAVAGIIGAKGNNGIGKTGINWDVKILPLSGMSTQATVIAAYQYTLDMRRLYNETNGEKGAYIVAVNYSAGIENRFGTDPAFKSWCDMYDAMAEVGILSVGATTNKNTNIDELGDIPTTCPSEYLISVTNVRQDDTKRPSAGYGPINVDLGAPGEGTFALGINQGYDQTFGGTSASCPHVSGVIALLYSVPCKAVADMALDDPKQAVTIIRDAILEGVDYNPTLDNITATNGRLNALGAMEKLQNTCTELQLPAPVGPLEIAKIIGPSNAGTYRIQYLTPDSSPYTIMISDKMGRVVHRRIFTPPTLGGKTLEVDLAGLTTGIYFISIYNNSNISTEKLFIP